MTTTSNLEKGSPAESVRDTADTAGTVEPVETSTKTWLVSDGRSSGFVDAINGLDAIGIAHGSEVPMDDTLVGRPLTDIGFVVNDELGDDPFIITDAGGGWAAGFLFAERADGTQISILAETEDIG